MLSWWAHWRARDTYTRTNLASRTPTHIQHKEISPFSTMQSLRPWSPFQCYSGVVEKKTISVLYLCGSQPTGFIKHLKPSITTPVHSEDKTAACKQPNNSSDFYRGKHSPTIMAIESPWATLSPQQKIFTAIAEERYTDHKMERGRLSICSWRKGK